MEETWNWITGEYFVRRWQCCSSGGGQWPAWLAWWYIAANAAITLAYHTIPLQLWGLSKRKRLKMPANVYLGFIFFIFFCGMGHLLDGVAAFWWPQYFFFAIWHTITALMSWWAASSISMLLKGSDIVQVSEALEQVEHAQHTFSQLRQKVKQADSDIFEVYQENENALDEAHKKLRSVLHLGDYEVNTEVTSGDR